MGRFLGQRPGEFGHGKLHGRLDETPDGSIYLATFPSLDEPRLTADQRASFGTRLVRYDTRTGQCEDLGTPVPGEAFPLNGVDVRRGILHGVGLLGHYLAFDLQTRKCLYSGTMPSGVHWCDRCALIDLETGRCFGSDPVSGQVVRYDPRENRICATTAQITGVAHEQVPAHPGMRCHTRSRLADGSFIVQTSAGQVFRFYPDLPRVLPVGPNWLDGCYCAAMATSLDGRYVYYVPGSHGSVLPGGAVLVQMDTKTHARKALAFLGEYALAHWGYRLGMSYSITAGPQEGTLLVTWNGRSAAGSGDENLSGEPAFVLVDIPLGERTGS